MLKSLINNIALILAIFLATGFAHAEEDTDGSVSGFISAQSAIHDGVYPIGSSDIGTDMGIAFTRSLQYVELRGMLTSTREGDFDNGKVRVSYLYADLGNGSDGIRLGRVQHLYGFSNLSRNLPHISDFITYPSAIYREQIRHLATSGDGFSLYHNHEHDSGWFSGITVTATKPVLEPMGEVVTSMFGSPSFGRFDVEKSRLYGFNLDIQSPDRSFQVRYDASYLKLPFVPGSGYLNGMSNTLIHTIGVRQYFDKFDVTAEMFTPNATGPAWDQFEQIGQGGYGKAIGYILTVRVRPTDDHQISAFINSYCTARNDCSGDRRSAATGYTVPSHRFREQSYGVAWRYNISKNWTSHVQYTWGRGTTSFITMNGPIEQEKWKMLQARVTYNF